MFDPTADLHIYFADFGVLATVLVAGAAVGETTILWEAPGRVISPFSGGVETTGPAALIRSDQVADCGITHGAGLIVADTVWHIVGLEPDGAGLTRLILSHDTDS